MPKVPQAKHRCKACLDTGKNSRGEPCAACLRRKQLEQANGGQRAQGS